MTDLANQELAEELEGQEAVVALEELEFRGVRRDRTVVKVPMVDSLRAAADPMAHESLHSIPPARQAQDQDLSNPGNNQLPRQLENLAFVAGLADGSLAANRAVGGREFVVQEVLNRTLSRCSVVRLELSFLALLGPQD